MKTSKYISKIFLKTNVYYNANGLEQTIIVTHNQRIITLQIYGKNQYNLIKS